MEKDELMRIIEAQEKKRKRTTRIIIAVVVVFFSLVVIGAIVSPSDSETNKSIAYDADQSSMAYVVSQDFIKAALKSPSTADFPFMDFKYQKVDSITYVVQSYVDSQNGFGAMIRTNWQTTVKFNGDPSNSNNWVLVDVSTY